MQFQEVVEAQGHLIDSHIMEQIFDTVVEYDGRFEVEEFRIGRTNSEPSYLRLRVEAPTPERWSELLARIAGPGLLAGGFGRRGTRGSSSATAARRKISTPPPTTAPTSRRGRNGSKSRTSAWTP